MNRLAVVALVLIPATISAQRGGGGRSSRTGASSEGSRGGSSMLRLSNGDVDEMSPIKRLIDKRKDLKLSDAQVKQFKDLESEMKTRNEHLFKQLDSLRKEMTFSGKPDDRSRIADDHQVVVDLVGNIRLSYNETLKRATELLDDEQKQKAAEIVDQLNSDAEKTLQEKLNGRGERGDGASGRRGRPPEV